MKQLIIANWKAQKNTEEAKHWVETFHSIATTVPFTIAVAPSFPLIPAVSEAIESLHCYLKLAVQTLSSYPAGSYTGAVSVKNIETLAVAYAILGHSERRQYFHETHSDVAKQVEQALSENITPIVCVDKEYLVAQANVLDESSKKRCVVAYEPLAAIGSGQAEDVGTVKRIIEQIRNEYGQVPVIYGGSVSQSNIAEYLTVSDGVLVGSASLDPHTFAELVNSVA